MRIAVVTLLYGPDGGPSAPLYRELCESLAARGHDVTVLAAVPHYPTGRVAGAWRSAARRAELVGGVRVIRLPVPSVDRARLPFRLLQFLVFQLRAAWAALRLSPDVALVGNPALEVFLPFVALASVKRVPTVFSVHDVYPDVGVALGVFRSRAVVAVVEWLERYCVSRAVALRILAPSFAGPARRLRARAVRLIYDWVPAERFEARPRCNDFALHHKLVDRFVVLYAGNLGFSQGLEHVVAAAARMRDDAEVAFVFVGDGAMREPLEQAVQAAGLTNVVFLPFQPADRVPDVLATADVCLVPLRRGLGRGSLPSKTLSIFAAGRPVLAAVDGDSDLADLVRRSGAGICVAPEDPEALAAAIVTLKRDEASRARMASAGRRFAHEHHRLEPAVDAFEDTLATAAAGGRHR
ncbi:MAG TPA: glycosyltransferase family 4 protein [Methylomirabilota bacterium]|jgi:colanic acid biosynthesis glycosyl transferase WcaI